MDKYTSPHICRYSKQNFRKSNPITNKRILTDDQVEFIPEMQGQFNFKNQPINIT